MPESLLSVSSPNVHLIKSRARDNTASYSPAKITISDTKNRQKYLLKKRAREKRKLFDKITKDVAESLHQPIMDFNAPRGKRKNKSDLWNTSTFISDHVIVLMVFFCFISFCYYFGFDWRLFGFSSPLSGSVNTSE